MVWQTIKPVVLALAVGLGLSACVRVDNSAPAVIASATLVRSDGVQIGSARLLPTLSGVILSVDAAGLSPGPHAIHLHALGRCDPPDFGTAGGHWNPNRRAHGTGNPAGAHAGDLPNIMVATDGRVSAQLDLSTAARASLGTLLDGDGAALVIHANPDDMRTDPSGNSGARMACGVLVRR